MAGAAAVVALVVVGLVVLVGGDDGLPADTADRSGQPTRSIPATTDPDETTDEPAPPSSTTTTLPPGGLAIDPVVLDELRAFVERERGLRFLAEVDVRLVDKAGLAAAYEPTMAAARSRQLELGNVLVGLGLVARGVDVASALAQLEVVRSGGHFDAETGRAVVRGTEASPLVRQVVVRLLTLALDDQHFGIDRLALATADDESAESFAAMVAGDARRIENAYVGQLSAADRQELLAEQFARLDDLRAIVTVPPALLDLADQPGTVGQAFVEQLLATGGQAALDAAFGQPPTTSEQLAHPERFIAGEAAVAVPPPEAPPDARAPERGSLGAALVERALRAVVDRPVAEAAALGWGGDAYLLYLGPADQLCLTAVVVGDTEADTEELRAAFTQWAAATGTTASGEPGQPVTITVCR